jgi:thiamine-monophosphate kinase
MPRLFAQLSNVRLSELGELGLLAELERRGLAEEIENDAAQLGNGLVVTQDSVVEGVHFRLDWLSWQELGFRAAAVNISDLAASGARPEALLVSLGVPGETELDDILGFYAGVREAGVPVRGGDTIAAPVIAVTIAAIGQSDRVPGRAGARPGDELVVTGPLGAAGAAFRENRYVRPPNRVEEGIELSRRATAMLDLSDGLGLDAGRIAGRSGCKLVVELERVPIAPGASAADLSFGEDYELLAATRSPGRFPTIGWCEQGAGVEIRRGGRPVELGGWDQFRRKS